MAVIGMKKGPVKTKPSLSPIPVFWCVRDLFFNQLERAGLVTVDFPRLSVICFNDNRIFLDTLRFETRAGFCDRPHKRTCNGFPVFVFARNAVADFNFVFFTLFWHVSTVPCYLIYSHTIH